MTALPTRTEKRPKSTFIQSQHDHYSGCPADLVDDVLPIPDSIDYEEIDSIIYDLEEHLKALETIRNDRAPEEWRIVYGVARRWAEYRHGDLDDIDTK